MQKIIVQKIDTKPTKTGGTLYTITDEKGSKFSGFHDSLASIQIGSTIEADIEVSGKFNNIKEWKLITPAKVTTETPTNTPVQQTGSQRSPQDRTSIERQVCLKCACEIHGGNDILADILGNAERMYHWVTGAAVPKAEVKPAIPSTSKPVPGPVTTAQSTSDKAFEDLKNGPERNETPVNQSQVKEIQVLMGKHGVSMTDFSQYAGSAKNNWNIRALSELKIWQYDQLKKDIPTLKK